MIYLLLLPPNEKTAYGRVPHNNSNHHTPSTHTHTHTQCEQCCREVLYVSERYGVC